VLERDGTIETLTAEVKELKRGDKKGSKLVDDLKAVCMCSSPPPQPPMDFQLKCDATVDLLLFLNSSVLLNTQNPKTQNEKSGDSSEGSWITVRAGGGHLPGAR
jgi:hypothetical protein